MKKLLVILTVAFTMLTVNAFCSDQSSIPELVKQGFNKEFNTPQDVKWEKKDGVFVAVFTLHDYKTCAAFDSDGKMLSIGRCIKLTQLPMNIASQLKSQYSNYTVDDNAIEVMREDDTNYFVTARNNDFTYHLKCCYDGNIYVEKRTKNK